MLEVGGAGRRGAPPPRSRTGRERRRSCSSSGVSSASRISSWLPRRSASRSKSPRIAARMSSRWLSSLIRGSFPAGRETPASARRPERGDPDDRVASGVESRRADECRSEVTEDRAQDVRAVRRRREPGCDDLTRSHLTPRAEEEILAVAREAVSRCLDGRRRACAARRVAERRAGDDLAPFQERGALKGRGLPEREPPIVPPRPVHEAPDRAALDRGGGGGVVRARGRPMPERGRSSPLRACPAQRPRKGGSRTARRRMPRGVDRRLPHAPSPRAHGRSDPQLSPCPSRGRRPP